MKRLFILGLLWALPAFADEAELLKKHSRFFARSGQKLTVTISGKKTRVFTDDPRLDKNFADNRLLAYFPEHHMAVIQHFYGEGGDYTLLSLQTGQEIKVAEKPRWNKTLEFFVSVNEGEFAGDKNGLQLGFCDKEKGCRLILEKDGRYSEAKWTGPYRLQVTNRVPAADGSEGLVLRVRCTVQRKSLKATCVP